jgi:hypothetical protein
MPSYLGRDHQKMTSPTHAARPTIEAIGPAGDLPPSVPHAAATIDGDPVGPDVPAGADALPAPFGPYRPDTTDPENPVPNCIA